MAPLTENSSKLLDRLKLYYGAATDTKPFVADTKASAPPIITPQTALICALTFTLLFVAPFYLSHTLRTSALTNRDATSVIRARVRAVGLTCVACSLITVYILAIYGHATPHDVARLLGLYPVHPIDIAKVLGLVMVLFAGPLFETVIIEGDWRYWGPSAMKETFFTSWTGYRNLVVGPISEELVFRSLTISLYLLAKVPPKTIVLTTPLFFGVAHVHHLAEFLKTYTPADRRLPPFPVIVRGLTTSLFQFTYTTLFGFFAAFVLIRTGNLYAAIIAHTFCNWMGVPRLWGRLAGPAMHPIDIIPDAAQGKKSDDHDDDEDDEANLKAGNSLAREEFHDASEGVAYSPAPQAPKQLSVIWTVAYYMLILGGSYGFYRLLWPLTESTKALATF